MPNEAYNDATKTPTQVLPTTPLTRTESVTLQLAVPQQGRENLDMKPVCMKTLKRDKVFKKALNADANVDRFP